MCRCSEEWEKDAEMPPVSHRPAHATRRRASSLGSPDLDHEVAEEVHKRMAKRMRQLPTLPGTPGEEDYSTDDDDELALRHRQKILNQVWIGLDATTIVKKIT